MTILNLRTEYIDIWQMSNHHFINNVLWNRLLLIFIGWTLQTNYNILFLSTDNPLNAQRWNNVHFVFYAGRRHLKAAVGKRSTFFIRFISLYLKDGFISPAMFEPRTGHQPTRINTGRRREKHPKWIHTTDSRANGRHLLQETTATGSVGCRGEGWGEANDPFPGAAAGKKVSSLPGLSRVTDVIQTG